MSGLQYQAFYCEENAYHLSRDPVLGDRPREVVFISNEGRACAMWNQRAAGPPGKAILWDYHVVVLAQGPWEIWDLDTHLGLPVPALEYLARSFRPDIPEEYLPRFRAIDAETFARSFASDRSHMRLPSGRYKRAPPPWPMIGVPDRASNLMRFVDMEAPFLGEVMDLAALARRVAP